LTLVSAPAGYGKSTLVSSWLETLDCPAIWLSLDENDSDLAVFLSYFIAAIQTEFPDIGANTLAMLNSAQKLPLETVATSLINELNRIELDYVLVLDDFTSLRRCTWFLLAALIRL
jgi:LuxR family maltose regulon positive regulatory protein